MININYCSHASAYFLGISLASMSLLGCQSLPIKSSQQLPVVNTSIKNTPAPIVDVVVKEAQLMQWSGHYDWQLAQVINQNGKVVNISNFAPITLQVEPSSVSFYQGCEQYNLDFFVMSAPPYPYYSHLVKAPATCNDDNDNNTAIKEDENIQTLFAKHIPVSLNFELLPVPNSISPSSKLIAIEQQDAPKRLALNIENGNRLIFTGSAKALPAPTGFPITNKLLEQYHWQLVSAVSNGYDEKGQLISRKPMGNFYHPDHPISASFESWPDNQYVSFSSDCNGSRAPYFLLKDNTFKVGTIISTVMGCGETGNRIETALFDLMRDSSSQLTLSLQPLQPVVETQADFPRYNLLQTMDSGETLVWQNKPLPVSKYLSLDSNQVLPDESDTTSLSND